jgi:uncharacterized protein (DUF1697 family)
MSKYIALLRGINVSGQKIMIMADLQKLFESMKFTQVKTYIQSGNVVFTSTKGSAKDLGLAIEKTISKKYGFDVPVAIRTAEELETVLASNPYRKTKLGEKERIYISYLSEVPEQAGIKKLEALKSEVDEIQVKNREVFILCRGGYGKTVFSNTLVEKCLGVKSTTRNLETTSKLVEMSR